MLHEFYQAVLPRTGYYTLFRSSTKRHTWCDSVDELASATEALGAATDIYFAVGSFTEKTRRTQENSALHRCLRLDIDAGPEKFAKHGDEVYPTKREALEATIGFTTRTGIAPTYIVSSGAGLHIYYCFTDDVPADVWHVASGRLARIGAAEHYRIDSSVTEDAARILRPVGTMHPSGKIVTILKDTGKVWDFSVMSSMLEAIDPGEPALTTPAQKARISVNAEFLDQIEGPPKSGRKIATACAQIRVVAATGEGPYEQWRAAVAINKFTFEGEALSHEWSAQSEEYSRRGTQEKFDNWEGGPPTCEHFKRHNPAGCDGCPHAGKIKSPIMLGVVNDEEKKELPPEAIPEPKPLPRQPGSVWDGKVPAPFFVVVDDDGISLCAKEQVKSKDKDGKEVTELLPYAVTHTVFWLGSWSRATNTEDGSVVDLRVYVNGEVSTYQMHEGVTASIPKLLEFLATKSVQATGHPKAGKAMQDYVKAQLQRVRSGAQRPKVTDRLGLNFTAAGELICAQGRYVIYGNGEVREAFTGEKVRASANAFALPLPPSSDCAWPATVWPQHVLPLARQHVDFLKKYYADAGLAKFRLAIMLGLASPFMAFVEGAYSRGAELPPNGMTVSLYSRGSGKGKTTVVRSYMAAYGNVAALVKEGNDKGATDLSRNAKASIWGTLPLAMDEMGNTRPEAVAELVNMIANGSGRERATKDGGLSSSATWALVNTIMANTSQRDMVASVREENSAIQARLLELNVDDVVRFDGTALDQFNADLGKITNDCAGALGGIIHLAICRAGAQNMNKLVTDNVSRAREHLGASQEARFQYRMLGAMLTLQQILTRLRLDMFDTDELVQTFKSAYEEGQTYVADSVMSTDPVDLVGEMLEDLKPFTIITKNESHLQLAQGQVDIVLNEQRPREIKARYIQSSGFTYMSAKAMRTWAVEHRLNLEAIVKAGKACGVLVPHDNLAPVPVFVKKMDLMKGTREAGPGRTSVYKVDVRRVYPSAEDNVYDASVAKVVPLRGGSAPATTIASEDHGVSGHHNVADNACDF